MHELHVYINWRCRQPLNDNLLFPSFTLDLGVANGPSKKHPWFSP